MTAYDWDSEFPVSPRPETPQQGFDDHKWVFARVGDLLEGKIAEIKTITVPPREENGQVTQPAKRMPAFKIVDDGGQSWDLLAGAKDLLEKISQERPQVGDRIKILMTGVKKLDGGRSLKLFSVEIVERSNGATPAQQFASASDSGSSSVFSGLG